MFFRFLPNGVSDRRRKPLVRHPAAQGTALGARPPQPPSALRKLAKVFFWFAAVLGILVMLGLGFLLLNYGSYLF